MRGLSLGTALGWALACASSPAAHAPGNEERGSGNELKGGGVSGKGGASDLPELTTHPLPAQGLVVELPGEKFSREQTYNGWSLVEDKALGVSLWVRLSIERRSISLAECEEQATGSLSILRRQRSALKKASTFRPQHFFGALWGLGAESGPEPVEGLWVVYAVSTARCLSAVYAVKPGPDAALWLTVGREFVLPSLRSVEVEERAFGTEAPASSAP